jgi:hypothetical protein
MHIKNERDSLQIDVEKKLQEFTRQSMMIKQDKDQLELTLKKVRETFASE